MIISLSCVCVMNFVHLCNICVRDFVCSVSVFWVFFAISFASVRICDCLYCLLCAWLFLKYARFCYFCNYAWDCVTCVGAGLWFRWVFAVVIVFSVSDCVSVLCVIVCKQCKCLCVEYAQVLVIVRGVCLCMIVCVCV